MNLQAESFAVKLTERAELAMIAVQFAGAGAGQIGGQRHRAALISDLKPFRAWRLATGLSVVPVTPVKMVWKSCCPPSNLLRFGRHCRRRLQPCAGRRDTLRLEAGMNLYGADMDESISLAANMA